MAAVRIFTGYDRQETKWYVELVDGFDNVRRHYFFTRREALDLCAQLVQSLQAWNPKDSSVPASKEFKK